jgi:hypothetical protein
VCGPPGRRAVLEEGPIGAEGPGGVGEETASFRERILARAAPSPKRWLRPAAPLALLVLTAASAALFVRRPSVRLEVGAFEGGLLGAGWSRSERADVDPPATTDGRTSFYYRAAPANGAITLPFSSSGAPLRLTLRATARVRSALGVFVSGAPAGEMLVRPGPWDLHTLAIPAALVRGSTLELALALRPLPLVRGAHVERPEVLVDYVEISSPPALRLAPAACLMLAATAVAGFAFAALVGIPIAPSLLVGLAAGQGAVLLAWIEPLPVLLAVPRLLPVALLCGLLAHRCLRGRTLAAPSELACLAALVAAGVLFHGSVVFFPDHSPPDIDFHVRRTLDLAGVPLDYPSILRYASQLPSASQDRGSATAALGESTLIPYSPLPYVFWYAASRLGMNLYWGMTVLDAALAMAVAPWLWVVADRLWGRGTAWLAALLYTLDLAVWHHVGRCHAPAVFGGALATAALLYLALRAGRMDTAGRAAAAGVILGVAALGYSSLVVLYGLFGLALLCLLLLDARGLTPAARRGVAGALVVGGLVAGALFYFHYVPGLLSGARGVEAEPDLFPGRTFFIFHNESRQSLRIWILGYWIPLLAGLLAAPLAFRRLQPAARPVMLSWLLAWALIMLLKEPAFFPKLLRWAKEDQFLSPLLCLLVAGGVFALPRSWMRWAGAAAAVATALWLQLRDFGHHANSLRL